MKIIKPIAVNDTTLVSSTIPVTTIAEWLAGTSYASGNEVIVAHRIYTSLAETNTGHFPPDTLLEITNADGSTEGPWWEDSGATNRWAMFDNQSRLASKAQNRIEVQLVPGRLFNAIALLNVVAASVTVTVTDPIDGLVYDRTISLLDTTGINDYYDWLFQPIATRPNVVRMDLPAYALATISIVLTGIGEIQVGELVVGEQRYIGTLLYGYSVGITDYSITRRDDDGNAVINRKAYSENFSVDLSVETSRVYDLKRTLAAYRAQGLVFVGDERQQESIVYGFIKDFSVVVNGHLKSSCSLEIEEMN